MYLLREIDRKSSILKVCYIFGKIIGLQKLLIIIFFTTSNRLKLTATIVLLIELLILSFLYATKETLN